MAAYRAFGHCPETTELHAGRKSTSIAAVKGPDLGTLRYRSASRQKLTRRFNSPWYF